VTPAPCLEHLGQNLLHSLLPRYLQSKQYSIIFLGHHEVPVILTHCVQLIRQILFWANQRTWTRRVHKVQWLLADTKTIFGQTKRLGTFNNYDAERIKLCKCSQNKPFSKNVRAKLKYHDKSDLAGRNYMPFSTKFN